MIFLNLSPLAVAIGLAAIAAALFALQQLRVRHEEFSVPTIAFWQAAAREAPRRVLREAFRHPLAYLLTLLICGLLWLIFAEPELDQSKNADNYILFLDASAHAANAGEFDAAKSDLQDAVDSLPEHKREVVFGGASNFLLLAPSEDSLVLARRLDGLSPEPAPSAINEFLRILAAREDMSGRVQVVIFGRAPVSPASIDNLPSNFTVLRRSSSVDSTNRGIVAMGLGTAASGDWQSVDVLIRVASSSGEALDPKQLEISKEDGTVLDVPVAMRDGGDFILSDVPANGSVLRASLKGKDANGLDDLASLRLPEKRSIRVLLVKDVPAPIRRALAADPQFMLVDSDPDVVIGDASGENATVPSLVFTSMASQDMAFQIGIEDESNSDGSLLRSIRLIGLDRIDASGLAQELTREISVSIQSSSVRRIEVWSELFSTDYNFTESRAFPVFLSRSVRWLAGERSWVAYVAAGKPLIQSSGAIHLGATVPLSELNLGAPYRAMRAGSAHNESSSGFEVALLDPTLVSLGDAAELPQGPDGGPSLAGDWHLIAWLMLAALGLLGLEWFLHQRGLMP